MALAAVQGQTTTRHEEMTLPRNTGELALPQKQAF